MPAVAPGRWELLLAEHRAHRLGVLWLEETARAVRAAVARYPPDVYAGATAWNPAAIEDLVQDVVVRQLLADRQVEYIADVADDLDAARGLIARQVRWTLARRRSRTVIDNLLDRCRGRAGRTQRSRDATHEEIVEAARRVARIPRVPVKGGDRAPMVFTEENLELALREVSDVLPDGFRDGDLDRIFSRVLTDHLPGALVVFEKPVDEADRSLTPEEAHLVEDTADQAYAELTPQQRLLLGMKMADLSDAAVGTALGMSRPTVAKRHRAAAAVARSHLADLPPRVQEVALGLLAERLLALLPPTTETATDT